MKDAITAATRLAGVVGRPIGHSLSPVLFAAWIEAAGIDAVYLAFAPPLERFGPFVEGLRGLAVGLNITAPFKQEALRLATAASERARRAGAANLLVFENAGGVLADNTDGAGLMEALAAAQGGFDPTAGPAAILGAGGAARAAAAALIEAGAPQVRILARRGEAALELAAGLGARALSFPMEAAAAGLDRARVVINATPQGQEGGEGPVIPLETTAPSAVVMDMVYRPARTAFIERAERLGHPTVDGLAMLIGQARPSFTALFGSAPPDIDIRAVALAAMSAGR